MLRVQFAIVIFILLTYIMQSFVFRRLPTKQSLIRVNGLSVYGLDKFEPKNLSKDEIRKMGHPLALSFTSLADILGGYGKAKIVWDHLKNGVDPLLTDDDADINENLSRKAKSILSEALDGRPLIPGEVTEETLSECGTRKMMIKLVDGQSIESVLIPAAKYDRTTLCVSSQIGRCQLLNEILWFL